MANYFSVDVHSGRLWVAATAPDEEDSAVDGVSEFGALYWLELVTAGDLTPSDWTSLDGYFTLAEGELSPGLLDVASGHL